MTEDEVRKLIPELINQFALAVKKLHQLEARTFWIPNTGPIGCLPCLLLKYPPKPGNIDEAGWIKSYNEVAKEFNRRPQEICYRAAHPKSRTNIISDVPAAVVAIKDPSSKITYDEYNHERYPPGDPSKRAFAYFVLTGGRFVYASLRGGVWAEGGPYNSET
ncbi:Cytochrome b-c1 complex subunit Rieske-5 mitochondrial, partial [Bienertia sinuspersici]